MAVFDIFSKRQKQLRGDIPEVFSYDAIPRSLRAQIAHIWRDAIGDVHHEDEENAAFGVYRTIVEILRREYGEFRLPDVTDCLEWQYQQELVSFLLGQRDHEKVLDAIEVSFRAIELVARDRGYFGRLDAADTAIEELNARFREHAVGYQFVDSRIVRVDAELLHVESVKPALTLLRSRDYAGAQQEFLSAHEHYRHGRAKEALAECLKALESVMKAICSKRGWEHNPNATCSVLIHVVLDKGLVPSFWTSHFSALRNTLESGVPTARNKLAGHGQGADIVDVPPHIVAYVLHMTASAIVFLVESERALP
jgi:hypothetical protein